MKCHEIFTGSRQRIADSNALVDILMATLQFTLLHFYCLLWNAPCIVSNEDASFSEETLRNMLFLLIPRLTTVLHIL